MGIKAIKKREKCYAPQTTPSIIELFSGLYCCKSLGIIHPRQPTSSPTVTISNVKIIERTEYRSQLDNGKSGSIKRLNYYPEVHKKINQKGNQCRSKQSDTPPTHWHTPCSNLPKVDIFTGYTRGENKRANHCC